MKSLSNAAQADDGNGALADVIPLADIEYLEWAALLVVVAALVRGYTGFGFAAIAITGLNLIWPPQHSVPVILLLDLVGTLGLLKHACQHADRPLIARLGLGALVGIPAGLLILTQVPESLLKLAISLSVLGMTLFLFRRSRPAVSTLPVGKTYLIGSVSGAFTAAASVGGLPVVCYLLGSGLSPKVQRASMVVFLAATDLLALLMLYLNGVFDSRLMPPFLMLLLPTLIGVQLGQWGFHRLKPASFHPVALPVLTALSLSGVGLGLYRIF